MDNSLEKKAWERLPYFIAFVYFILCVIFAFERILGIDNSYFFFNIINTQSFFCPENRFGVWLSQIPLLLSIKLNLGLKSILYIYSVSFPVLYLLIIWCCSHVLQNQAAALSAILGLIIGVAYSFFHPVTETHEALAYTSLFLGILTSPRFNKPSIGFYALSVIVLTWCLLTHPIAVYTVSFVLAISFIFVQVLKLRRLWWVRIASVLILAASVKMAFQRFPL